MIKTVIFDIDGTMYDYESCNRIAIDALYAYCREQFGITREVFQTELKEADRIMVGRMKRSCASIHNRLIRYQCMLELLKQPLFPHALTMYELYWNTMLEHMKPMEGLLAWMQQLKEKGIHIATGTNMTALMQYKKLEQLQAAPYIEWIVSSEEAGVEKPDPELFALCIEKSGVKAEECLFVGDSLKADVFGAKAAGMQTLWLCNDPKKEADPSVNRIYSYCECLDRDF